MHAGICNTWVVVLFVSLQLVFLDAVGASTSNSRQLLAQQLAERKYLLQQHEFANLPQRRLVKEGNAGPYSPLDLPGDLRWTAPNLTLIIFIVNMCDLGGGTATNPESVWRLLRNGNLNLAGYYDKCSYGRTKLDVDRTTVVGPITMPCNGTTENGPWTVTSCHNTNPYGWFSWVERYATTKYNINLSDYNHRVMIMPKAHQTFQEADCNWAGISSTGPLNPQPSDPSTYSFSYTFIAGDSWDNLWLWFHELGHALWLQHANTPTAEYGDVSSAMGTSKGYGLRCYNSPQVWQLGWGSPFVLLTRDELSPGTTVLRWIPSADVEADHFLRLYLAPTFSPVDRSGVPNICMRQVWVSYRKAVHAYDMPWKEMGTGAVLVHTWEGYAFSSTPKTVVQAVLRLPNAKTPSDVKDSVYELPACRIVVTALDMWDGYALIGVCVKTSSSNVETDCGNGLDDDCDGLIDTKDPDCRIPMSKTTVASREPPPPPPVKRESEPSFWTSVPGLIYESLLEIILPNVAKTSPVAATPPPAAVQASNPPPAAIKASNPPPAAVKASIVAARSPPRPPLQPLRPPRQPPRQPRSPPHLPRAPPTPRPPPKKTNLL